MTRRKKGITNQNTKENLFQKHQGLIRKAIKDVSVKKIDYDDLLEEAYIAFCLACSDYDKKKGEFTTHLYSKVRYHLLDYVKKEIKRKKRISEYEIFPDSIHDNRGLMFDFQHFVSGLSNDAVLLVGLMLSQVGESDGLFHQQKKMVYKQFVKGCGWSSYRRRLAIKQIKRRLREYVGNH